MPKSLITTSRQAPVSLFQPPHNLILLTSGTLGDLHLHPWPWESQSRMWTGGFIRHTKGFPPQQEPMEGCIPKELVKKQVRFHVDEDLGDDPTLPTDLTYILEGDTAEEWDNVDPPQPLCDDGHQHHPTHMGGACLKAPVKPSASAWSQSKSWIKGLADPVDHPNQWIKAELDRVGSHHHWWKEIRALKRYTLQSAIKRYTIERDGSESGALYFSQWQAAAFQLPLAQQEALGWWAPPCFHGLHPQDYLLHINASGTRNFWTNRQEKSLSLARALQ